MNTSRCSCCSSAIKRTVLNNVIIPKTLYATYTFVSQSFTSLSWLSLVASILLGISKFAVITKGLNKRTLYTMSSTSTQDRVHKATDTKRPSVSQISLAPIVPPTQRKNIHPDVFAKTTPSDFALTQLTPVSSLKRTKIAGDKAEEFAQTDTQSGQN